LFVRGRGRPFVVMLRATGYLPKNSINSITVPSGSSQQNTFIQPPPKYTRAGGL
jgi:hypothetical protein